MKKISPKTHPNTFFSAHKGDLNCHIHDLKYVLEKIEEIDMDLYNEPESCVAEEDGLITYIFPDIERKSFIISLLIALENEFKLYCNMLQEIENIPIKWNELKGPALERFINYTEKFSGLKVVIDQKKKNLVSGLIEIRNCIIHNNSYTVNYGKLNKIKHFIKMVNGFTIKNGYLEISFDACMKCADIIFDFMEDAYMAALAKYPNDFKD